MRHETVEVDHLLLGLFADQDGVAGRVFAEFGLTVASVRDLVRERRGVGSSPPAQGQPRFSQEAKDALRSANRFALGKPGTAHMLVVIVGRGEGGACEILRALGADPRLIRFETKKRAWPSRSAGPRPEVRVMGSLPLESLPVLDFED